MDGFASLRDQWICMIVTDVLSSFEMHRLLLMHGVGFDLIYSAVQLEIFDIVKDSGWRTHV